MDGLLPMTIATSGARVYQKRVGPIQYPSAPRQGDYATSGTVRQAQSHPIILEGTMRLSRRLITLAGVSDGRYGQALLWCQMGRWVMHWVDC